MGLGHQTVRAKGYAASLAKDCAGSWAGLKGTGTTGLWICQGKGNAKASLWLGSGGGGM